MFAFRKMALDESAAETRIEGFEEPSDWSRDGWMAGTRASEATKGRKIQVGPANGGERVNLTNTPGSEAAARFSPDSKWVAYSSDETGRSEIYVRPFPGHADSSPARVQISDNGGEYPMWNETGAELYYLSAGDMVFAVNTRALAMGNVAAPAPLFKACPQSQPGTRPMEGMPYMYPLDTRDGQRFVVACLVDRPTEYTVLMNWAGISR